MKAFLSILSLCFVLATGTAWAGLVGTTNPGDFQDTADWCVNFGCLNDGAPIATPQPWISTGGLTGLVGNNAPSDPFYNLQNGVTWGGDFPDAMGLLYNGASYGSTPSSMVVTFDQANYGAGTWIDADFFGDFLATVQLYDINMQPLGSPFTVGGVSGVSAVFLGITDTAAEVWAAEFVAYGTGSFEPDFAIGTLSIATSPVNPTIPEPASFLLIGPALLAAGLLKKRLSH